jgi:hypothetical protein
MASLAVLVGRAGSVAAASNDACPQGFETITLSKAASEGYIRTPSLVDSLGNGDGIVCRRPLGEGTLHMFPGVDVTQIYYWIDDVTPRGGP